MARPHVLYYAQDPGGTRYLDPVIAKLIADDIFDWSILLHPFAKNSVFMDDLYTTQRIDFSDSAPASESYFGNVLNEHEPDVIICTSSAQARDASNGALIASARQNGISCLAALDHWKGLDRFFDGPHPHYFPDQLICIDDATKVALGKSGLDITKVRAVGHPGLEHITAQVPTTNNIPLRVLLVSQPIVQDGAYHGIYDEPMGKIRLIDQIANALDEPDFDVYLRRHPKEHSGASLPSSVRDDEILNWDMARAHYDVFVGFDSMALIEAALSGAPCVRLALPELAHIADQPVPLNYGIPTNNMKDLAIHIRTASAQCETVAINPFAGSTKRAADVIRNFVNSNI